MAVSGAHHENPHRGLGLLFYLPASEITIEPANVELAIEVVEGRFGAELHLTGIGSGVASMGPGAHQKVDGRIEVARESEVILDGAARVRVVPARDEQHRDVRGLLVIFDPVHVGMLEIFPIIRVRQHGQNEVFEVRRGR